MSKLLRTGMMSVPDGGSGASISIVGNQLTLGGGSIAENTNYTSQNIGTLGTNNVMFICIADRYAGTGAALVPSSVTWNGVSATQYGTHEESGGLDEVRMSVFRLLNPASGSNTLNVTYTATFNPSQSTIGVFVVEGLKQDLGATYENNEVGGGSNVTGLSLTGINSVNADGFYFSAFASRGDVTHTWDSPLTELIDHNAEGTSAGVTLGVGYEIHSSTFTGRAADGISSSSTRIAGMIGDMGYDGMA